MRPLLIAAQLAVLLIWQGVDAAIVLKGKLPAASFTRIRDCSPWGLDPASGNSKDVNPAFNIYSSPQDPLDFPRGVINNYYYFKVMLFVPQLETALAMRAVKVYAEVLWNINAHFRNAPVVDTLGMLKKNPSRRRPLAERSVRNRNIAIAFGLTRVTAYLLPQAGSDAQIVLDTLMDTKPRIDSKSFSQDPRTPWGIGNLCAAEMIAFLKRDGWNSEGDMTPDNPFPFFDYTGYVPVNSFNKVVDPSRWQPLVESNQLGYFQVQTPVQFQIASNGNRIKHWSVTPSYAAKKSAVGGPGWSPGLTGQSLQWMKGNVSAVLAASAGLTDYQKLMAEFFDAKITSYGGFERLFAFQNNWGHDDWIEYEQLSACLYDATIIAWRAKARTDATRPMSVIRWLVDKGHLPSTVRAWAGAGQGTRTIRTKSWQSYLRTMPHTEWPSGTSCLCQVFTEWTALYNKNKNKDAINLELNWKKGCGATEPGAVPANNVRYTFKSLKQLNEICSQSRSWAGVHFQSSLGGGQKMCSGIAAQCRLKVQRLKMGQV